MQEVEWGGTLGSTAGSLRQVGWGRGCLWCCPRGISGQTHPSDRSSPRHECPVFLLSQRAVVTCCLPLPPTASPGRGLPWPESALLAAVPEEDLSWAGSVSQTALCAGTLFQSPASVFTVSRVVLKTSHVLLFLSPETARAAPCHLLLAWPTKPSRLTPAFLSVSFTSAFTICFTASFCPAVCPFSAPCLYLLVSFLSGRKLLLTPKDSG